MNPYLSETMPELTEEEWSHRGSYYVSWYEPDVGWVGARYCSIKCFIDKNHLPEDSTNLIQYMLNNGGKCDVMTPRGLATIKATWSA